MAKVIVSRQVIDEENNLTWAYFEVEEDELSHNEGPLDLDMLLP